MSMALHQCEYKHAASDDGYFLTSSHSNDSH